MRRDPFDATKKAASNLPGPGNYVDNTDTFGRGKGAGFGAKYKSPTNSNPGPGQYNADRNKFKASISKGVKMGTTQRADLWGSNKKKMEDTPGPGNFGDTYSSFKTGKGASFGGKYKTI